MAFRIDDIYSHLHFLCIFNSTEITTTKNNKNNKEEDNKSWGGFRGSLSSWKRTLFKKKN